MFVDAGFILVEPNVRGSDGYGKTWLDADNGAEAPRRDHRHRGRRPLRAREVARATARRRSVGVIGGSYGGYATLVAMTMFAGTYDAGASIVGISNLETFLRNTAPYRRILRISEYGDPDTDADALRKLSPVTYLDRVKAPLLLIQGVNDPRVPVGEAIQIHDLLEKRGVTAPLILFADEGHGAARRSNAALQLGHITQVLRRAPEAASQRRFHSRGSARRADPLVQGVWFSVEVGYIPPMTARARRQLLALIAALACAPVGRSPARPTFADAGLYLVREGDLMGLIDRTGKAVLAPEFEELKLGDGLVMARKGYRVAYFDAAGAMAIKPQDRAIAAVRGRSRAGRQRQGLRATPTRPSTS